MAKLYTVYEYDFVREEIGNKIDSFMDLSQALKTAKDFSEAWCEGEIPTLIDIEGTVIGIVGHSDYGTIILEKGV